ncbi:class I SAM-dependent methyltransferase [Vibrio sp. SCSIO 43136]|uniref:class I SAM-dependent methyltransferase n=1 Tax=Vibrio sp. SCSIO 43136 TaxID=2819101 RepID=UPI002075D0B8|nr:class I SAM-dependent methyltransferase [Vibrio sp. SCSIO 43136]USD65930.1 class I SAM-dependent methyltransferase [Vibrio sp. SCSIO 43136]
MESHTLFSDRSDLYEVARPLYPEALFEYLATLTPAHQQAWDCACGNGQAADSLVRFFDHVQATDVSPEQIANAKPNPRVHYSVTASENTNFGQHSFDLVCVAQALHWFDFEQYWPEVKRVLKPQGIFAAWGYTWPKVSDQIDPVFKQHLLDIVEPYWAKQNRLLWDHYRDIDIPFTRLEVPEINMQMSWTLDEFMSFLCTFSATRRCIADIGDAFVDQAYAELEKVWGDRLTKRQVDLEFILLAGRNDANEEVPT